MLGSQFTNFNQRQVTIGFIHFVLNTLGHQTGFFPPKLEGALVKLKVFVLTCTLMYFVCFRREAADTVIKILSPGSIHWLSAQIGALSTRTTRLTDRSRIRDSPGDASGCYHGGLGHLLILLRWSEEARWAQGRERAHRCASCPCFVPAVRRLGGRTDCAAFSEMCNAQ